MNQLPTRPALSTPDARELDPHALSQPSSPEHTPVTRRLARGSIRMRSVGCLLLLLGAWLPAAHAAPVGTAFTYQGRLDQLGVPANGNCQFRFSLWNAEVGGTQIGSLLEVPTALSDGTFTVQLDFGAGAFDGEERWLDISVLCDGDVEWTPLDPRQPITPGPYSIYSSTGAGGGDGVWTTGTWGIEHFGNVGIGLSAHPGFRLRVGTSTSESLNPMQVTNNDVSHATLWVQNLAVDGIGIYDADSDRHFLAGRLGIGTLSPASPLHVSSSGSLGIKAESLADGVAGTLDAAIWAKGNGSVLTSKCAGLYAESSYGNGVEGYTSDSGSYGGYFQNLSGGTALYANGIAKVKTLQILGGADLVEGFDTSESAAREPGTVVVIDPAHPGALRAAFQAYDHRVAGVVSGAGGVAAGLRLGQEGVMDGDTPVAMSGRVYVKCSAENGAIEAGDLLTTADTPGHAMRTTDSARSHGAVIGKAMTALESGTGLVLVLVNLQ